MSVYKVRGFGGELEVFEDKVTIAPKGMLGFLTKGLKGTKSIPFESITGIQHKKAGLGTNGYIQFSIPGGNENKGGVLSATSDENSFVYRRGDNATIEEIKEYIERRTKEMRGRSSSSSNMAEELTKLADLRKQGILSEEEFSKAKQRLIG